MVMPFFPTDPASIRQRLQQADPVAYGKTRNFIDGAVTRLSPYISRGVITLPEIRDHVLARGYKPPSIEKFLQELAWREYFQRVWWHKGDALFSSLKQEQTDVLHYQVPVGIRTAATGIAAIDEQIRQFYATGYLHNHARMYIAGITCNLARAHWWQPSRWMYYHLLDGDLASNTCSWQWVAGSFSSKKYIANQENINHYLHSNQRHTYLDQSYDTILQQPVPPQLQATEEPQLSIQLPTNSNRLLTDPSLPVCLYTSYWLNPGWRQETTANRILLLEPDHFNRFPVSSNVLQFILDLARQNISGIQVFVGNFHELQQQLQPGQPVYYPDHPLHRHFRGTADPYPWLFPEVQGYHGSFFSFWKKVERYLYRGV